MYNIFVLKWNGGVGDELLSDMRFPGNTVW